MVRAGIQVKVWFSGLGMGLGLGVGPSSGWLSPMQVKLRECLHLRRGFSCGSPELKGQEWIRLSDKVHLRQLVPRVRVKG